MSIILSLYEHFYECVYNALWIQYYQVAFVMHGR